MQNTHHQYEINEPRTQRQSRSQNDSHENENNGSEQSGPDYIAMQYRQVRVDNGWRTRKERIGAAFNNTNGSICFRPAGQQIIEGDIYLFPQ